MTKRLQYPNKPNLIKLASELYEAPSYALCGFREFNTENPPNKQVFAIRRRILDWWEKDHKQGRKKVVILCYLLKGSKLKISPEVIAKVQETFPSFYIIVESEVSK